MVDIGCGEDSGFLGAPYHIRLSPSEPASRHLPKRPLRAMMKVAAGAAEDELDANEAASRRY
jgi:hypothetical protein